MKSAFGEMAKVGRSTRSLSVLLVGSASVLALTMGMAFAADAAKPGAAPKASTAQASAASKASTPAAPVVVTAQAETPPSTTPPPARAADANSDRVERVTVTAQKRKERLVDVPLSVSVVTDKDIKNKSTYNLTEIGEKLPNVNAGGSYSASFTIRGITSGTSGSGFAPNMGVNVDEVFMARDRSFDTGVADIERIEVLRGPQGTLYGKNTIAGTINVTTKRPTNEYEALGDLQVRQREPVRGARHGQWADRRRRALASRHRLHAPA